MLVKRCLSILLTLFTKQSESLRTWLSICDFTWRDSKGGCDVETAAEQTVLCIPDWQSCVFLTDGWSRLAHLLCRHCICSADSDVILSRRVVFCRAFIFLNTRTYFSWPWTPQMPVITDCFNTRLASRLDSHHMYSHWLLNTHYRVYLYLDLK